VNEHHIASFLDELDKIKEAGGGLQKGLKELVRPSGLGLKKRLSSAWWEIKRQAQKGPRHLV